MIALYTIIFLLSSVRFPDMMRIAFIFSFERSSPMIRKYKNLIPKVPASCFIFPTAEIIGSVELGEDVIVYPGTVVRAGYGKITIGNKTNLQENVTFHVETGYDIHVGAGVTIGHNAIIHGCTIHDNVLVGMGAIIQEGAVIEENCFIGAGAIVASSAPSRRRNMMKSAFPRRNIRNIRQNTKDRSRKMTAFCKKKPSFSFSKKP